MALKNYGVLKGIVVDVREGRYGISPHYQIRVVDELNDFRIAINVKGKAYPNELMYTIVENFEHPILERLKKLKLGFNEIKNKDLSIDYINGDFFEKENMKVINHNIPGPDNDLNEKISKYVNMAMCDDKAIVYAFGEAWEDERKKDNYFGFFPSSGIHDVHMNQDESLKNSQNKPWQDGGLIFEFPNQKKFVAVFLAFQHQLVKSSYKIEVQDLTKELPKIKGVYIAGAVIDPFGIDLGNEKITLVNTNEYNINLKNWKIYDSKNHVEKLGDLILNGNSFLEINLSGKGLLLPNKGVELYLKDDYDNLIHKVSYNEEDISNMTGRLILFER